MADQSPEKDASPRSRSSSPVAKKNQIPLVLVPVPLLQNLKRIVQKVNHQVRNVIAVLQAPNDLRSEMINPLARKVHPNVASLQKEALRDLPNAERVLLAPQNAEVQDAPLRPVVQSYLLEIFPLTQLSGN